MLSKKETACFTGHRELREPYQALFLKTQKEVEILIQNGYRFLVQAAQEALIPSQPK